MKAVAINGSPRRARNTGKMLENALEGAASEGAETDLVYLYGLDFKGCSSCFACKRVGGQRRCFMCDGLSDTLEKMRGADVLVFGSPVYFYGVSSGLRAALERFFFPGVTYDESIPTWYEKRVPNAFIYTMNVLPERFEPNRAYLNYFEKAAQRHLKCAPEILCAYNTMQYDDYSKYEHAMFSAEEKLRCRGERFPLDCRSAFDLGASLARRAKEILTNTKGENRQYE